MGGGGGGVCVSHFLFFKSVGPDLVRTVLLCSGIFLKEFFKKKSADGIKVKKILPAGK